MGAFQQEGNQDLQANNLLQQQQRSPLRCSLGMGEYRPERAWQSEQLLGENYNVMNKLHSIMERLQHQSIVPSQHNRSEDHMSTVGSNWSPHKERSTHISPSVGWYGAFPNYLHQLCESAPLGLHLDEATSKIWEGRFVDVFNLVQPEKESIDKSYRRVGDSNEKLKIIPRTINNWLHGFSVYASVLCEKFPEKGSSLFCYLELIWGAYRTYGGVCWLKYDEQFHQRMAARAYMRWDCQDMNLWLLNMTPNRPVTSLQPGAGTSAGTSVTGNRRGQCWLYNERHCR
ncbi:hypothetical protein XELAEV_18035168mg, partial [Xenopus laevis]